MKPATTGRVMKGRFRWSHAFLFLSPSFILSVPSLVGAPEGGGLLLASQSAHAGQSGERVVEVVLANAIHGLLSENGALVVAGNLDIAILDGAISQEARARTCGTGGGRDGSDGVGAPDLSTRTVLVHPVGRVGTFLAGPNVQLFLLRVELSNGPVEAGGVSDTSPGGVNRAKASEGVVAGSRELKERSIILAVSLAV